MRAGADPHLLPLCARARPCVCVCEREGKRERERERCNAEPDGAVLASVETLPSIFASRAYRKNSEASHQQQSKIASKLTKRPDVL